MVVQVQAARVRWRMGGQQAHCAGQGKQQACGVFPPWLQGGLVFPAHGLTSHPLGRAWVRTT